MPWQVRIEIRRNPALIPVPKTAALAKAVAAVLPVADAAMPGLFREMVRLRRDALAAGRPSVPSSGEAP
jgi:hypothetical protein